ncbi:uncharacterized protein LOC129099469 [Anoplopoma fimbria]|uniref:uncharacterized protein LOC129099469 n=1 Tax=Anoplopoma fimbria TaxID=229290 RepID=UPI0023EBE916|nr:uncharacterized protein LOC129099469 [Anoplopoma fimbria]
MSQLRVADTAFITNLTKSDAGKYRCVLQRTLTPFPSYWEVEIRVEEASVPSASTLTTTQCLSFSTGSYTPSSPSPEGTAEAALMYVGLSLAAVIILFLFAALMYCRKQASIGKEPPVETEDSNVPEDNNTYEEIREEDRQSQPPVEVSTGYTYTKPNGVKPTDEYSFATAATSLETIEDSGKVIYSEVDFADGTAASLNSAPCGGADKVVYSAPQVEERSFVWQQHRRQFISPVLLCYCTSAVAQTLSTPHAPSVASRGTQSGLNE